MKPPKDNPGPTPAQTMRGGEMLTVAYLLDPALTDAAQDVRTEDVLVRQLPLSRMRELEQALTDEGQFIGLLCGKDPEWADSLTLDSQFAVAQLGRQLNYPTLQRWVEQRKGDLEIHAMLIHSTSAAVMDANGILVKTLQSMLGSSTSQPTPLTGTDSPTPK